MPRSLLRGFLLALEGELTWFPLDVERINALQEAMAMDGTIDAHCHLPHWVTEIEDKWSQCAKHRY